MDFNELVGVAFADFGGGGDLLKFFVEEFDGLLPIDNFGDVGEEEFDRFPEVLPQDVLLGGVLVGSEGCHDRNSEHQCSTFALALV